MVVHHHDLECPAKKKGLLSAMWRSEWRLIIKIWLLLVHCLLSHGSLTTELIMMVDHRKSKRPIENTGLLSSRSRSQRMFQDFVCAGEKVVLRCPKCSSYHVVLLEAGAEHSHTPLALFPPIRRCAPRPPLSRKQSFEWVPFQQLLWMVWPCL